MIVYSQLITSKTYLFMIFVVVQNVLTLFQTEYVIIAKWKYERRVGLVSNVFPPVFIEIALIRTDEWLSAVSANDFIVFGLANQEDTFDQPKLIVELLDIKVVFTGSEQQFHLKGTFAEKSHKSMAQLLSSNNGRMF